MGVTPSKASKSTDEDLESLSLIQLDAEVDVSKENLDKPILFTVQGQSTSELNGEFVHSQIFIDVLLRIKPNQSDRNELIARCNKTYKGNDSELAIVHEFSKKYSPDRALW